MDREDLGTTLILIPVLGLMGWAGLTLWRDYQARPGEEAEVQIEREVLGTVSFVNNNVKRKTSESPYWNPIEKETPVHLEDSIRTGPDSYAVVKLKDSTILEINENSLIVIDKKAEKMSVDFKVGDLTTKSASANLDIKVADSTITGASGELKLKTGSDQKTDIVVTRGQATLVDSQKRAMALGQQNAARVGQGQAQTLVVPVLLQSPKDGAVFLTGDQQRQISFVWTVLDKGILAENLEVSSSAEFRSEYITRQENHQAGSAVVRRGDFFWRVTWKDSNGNWKSTDPRRLFVRADQRLTLVQPADATRFELASTTEPVAFSWTSQQPARRYHFELASSPDFSQMVESQKLETPRIELVDLKAGAYYWRVSAFNDSNEDVGRSNTGSFQLSYKLPEAPRLLAPELGLEWKLKDPLRMEWEKFPDAIGYRVFISRDPDQKQIVKSEAVTFPFYVWRWQEPGSYHWSVHSLGPQQQPLSRSRVAHFSIKADLRAPPIRLVYPLNQGTVRKPASENIDPITFQWKADPGVQQRYTLILSRSPDFKEIFKKEGLTDQASNIRLTQASTYYWKVVSDASGAENSPSSPVWAFNLELSRPFLPPELTRPLPEEKIPRIEKLPVDFAWNPASDAVRYRITLEKLNAGTGQRETLVRSMTYEPRLKSLPLESGEYSWSVESIDEGETASTPSPTRRFFIEMKESMKPPRLRPPVVK